MRARSLTLLAFLSVSVAFAQSAPSPFTYVVRTGVATNVTVTSEAKTVTGFTGELPVSVSGGIAPQYKVGSGAFTSAPGTITAGQTLTIRHTSSSAGNTESVTTVTVGDYSTPFKSITGNTDRTPDAFTFGEIVNTPPNSFVESQVLTLSGFNTGVPVVAGSGAQYRIDGGSWTNASGTLNPNQTIQARHLTAAGELAYTKTSIKVGGIDGTFTTRNRSNVNVLPTANAGEDQLVDENTEVTLDGSASTDDGTLTYAWEQTGGTDVVLSGADTATPGFTAPDVSGDETLSFELTVTDDRGATATDSVQVTVLDTRVISISDAEVQEGAGVLELTVTVTPAAGRAISVDYATADETARDGADYAGGDGVLTIPAGGASALIVIPITGDAFDENDETFTVGLTNPQGAQIGNGLATITIRDDDADLLRVGSAKRSVAPSQKHLDGVAEARPYAGIDGGEPAAGAEKMQRFGLGGNGLSDLPNSAMSTEPHIGNGWATANYRGLERDGSEHSTYVRAFVVEEPDGDVVAFVTLDAIGAGNIIQRDLKAKVAAAALELGVTLAPDNILFGQTHSHAAADLQGLWGGVPATWLDCDESKYALDGCGPEDGWTAGLYQLAAAAVQEALAHRVPATLKVATAMRDLNGTRSEPATPGQTTDKALTVLQAREAGNESHVVGTVLQYAAHPTTVDDRRVQTDYVLAALIDLEDQGGTALYYNGPIADTSKRGSYEQPCSPGDTGGFCNARGYGRKLATEAKAILAAAAVDVAPTVTARHATAMLPVTNPAFLAAGVGRMFNRYYNFVETPVDTVPQVALVRDTLPQVAPFATTTVSRVTLGDPAANAGLEIATIPGEGRNSLGQLIRHLAYGGEKAAKPMMLLGLTHNSFGYIIPEQEFGGALHTGELYEEIVSLGPLTAPLLRLQAYFPLFDVPPEAYAPEYVTACQATPDSNACMLEILEWRYLTGENGFGGALAGFVGTIAEGCHEYAPTAYGQYVCNTLDFVAEVLGSGPPPAGGDAALAAAAADAAARGCDILDPSHCLLPFPSDHFTVAAAPGSPQSAERGGTGRRIELSMLATPRNGFGKPIDPTEWNRNDGFSPGQQIFTYVPNVATVKDASGNPTGPVVGAPPITDIGRSLDVAGSSVVVLDTVTGQPHPVWAEIDLNAGYLLPADKIDNPDPTKDARPALIVRPAKNFVEGRRYVVVLKNLKHDATGATIPAGPAFATCRDGRASALPAVQARCAALEDGVFPVLEAAGIPVENNAGLYLAWDFTVASAENNIARLRHMRDDAFVNYLGQVEAPDGSIVDLGRAPSFKVTQVSESGGERTVQGSFTIPSYVVPSDPSPLERERDVRQQLKEQFPQFAAALDQFNNVPRQAYTVSAPPNRLFYNPADAVNPADPFGQRYGDGLPDRTGEMTATFTCRLPRNASAATRPIVYGHGLLGGQEERGADHEYDMMYCKADWFGFAFGDVPNVVTVLADVSNFPVIPDGSQQGMVNQMFLARLLRHPEGFVSDPAFRKDGAPLFDNREVFYDGNSQGGILGGVVVALSKDITRGVLGVVGMNYSTLLQRSVDYDGQLGIGIPPYSMPTYLGYQDDLDRQLVFSMMQMLWDRSENNGYAHHITNNAALKGPDKQVLLHPAFADHQVTHWSAHVMARTIGVDFADMYQRLPGENAEFTFPTKFDFFAQRDPDEADFWGMPLVGRDAGAAYDAAGCTTDCRTQRSALVEFDEGRTAIPPIGNVPPRADDHDPHGYPRGTIFGRCQKSHFLHTQGRLIDVRGERNVTSAATCPALPPAVGSPVEPAPPVAPPAAGHGLAGCALSQDPALCQAALESLAGLQGCFNADGINCAYEVAHDAIGADTAANFLRELFAQCAASPGAPACSAVRSTADGSDLVSLPVLSRPIPRGDLAYAAEAAATPSTKTVDGSAADWMAQGTRIGGTDLFEYGEHVYTDFLFDAFGADDGDDARRWATLALLGEATSRTERVDALQQAGGDQLGVPQPGGTSSDHYGDAANREDGTDLVEVRWAADGSDLYFLARTARLLDAANAVVVVLADQDVGAGMQGLDAGLTTSMFDHALVLDAQGGRYVNLLTGQDVSLAAANGAVAASAADNALEARIPRTLLERPDGKLKVAVFTARRNGAALVPANVAYRFDEPVTIYSERAQALALFAGSIDAFTKQLAVADLAGGRTEAAKPGFGYHERQFTSGANISRESDTEEGPLQPYGVFVPSAARVNTLNQARMTIWTHYRGGKAHSGASWTPRLFWQLGEEQGNIVVSPRARGTSTWYTTRAHQDFFEVFADAAGTRILKQYAQENLPADSEATEQGLFFVDPARVYISGYSMGGFATYLFTGLYPDLFAAGFGQSGAVTQGAWTGIGPDPGQPGTEGCGYSAPEDFPEVGGASPCFVEANDGRANAQLNYRILENTRYVPISIHHGTNDELALTPGALRMGARLAELQYQYDATTFIGYEHFTQAIVDEWRDGARYLNLHERPENPRAVTYKLVPALVEAVNEAQLKGWNGNAAFAFNPDGAYWVDGLVVRDAACDGDCGRPGQDFASEKFGRIDAESGRLPGITYVPVPRTGTDADVEDPYVSTPAFSPANHSTPFVRHSLYWQKTGDVAGDANTFSATLTNLAAATLDLARMGQRFDEAITGTVATDGASTLTLANVGADMTVCVDGAAAGDVLAGGDAVVELAGDATVRLLPGLGASCAGGGDPAPAEPNLAACYTHPEHEQCVLRPLSLLLSENQRNACFAQGLDDADCPLSAVLQPLQDNDPSGASAALVDVLSDVAGCATQPASPFCQFSADDCDIDPTGTACAVAGVLEVVYDLNDQLGLPLTGPEAGNTACDQPAGDPEAGTQAWRQRDLLNMVCAMQRMSDEYANPDFHLALSARSTPRTFTWNLVEQLADPTRPRLTLEQWIPGGRSTDPYRVDQDWAAAGRGRVTHVSFIAESGARLVGRVFRPPASIAPPYPSIVITTGSIQGYQEMYNWAAEGLAEAGYLVFTYDVQGQGRSETLPHDDGGTPSGMQGVPFQQAYNFEQGTRDALRWLLSSADAPYATEDANTAGTELYNPHAADVDRSALGVAGHSLGASAVSLVGQEQACEPGTPRVLRHDCISAIVGWDALAARGTLKAPGLSLTAEYFFNPTPAQSEPNPETGTAAFEAFKAAGVDSMRVSLRSSTHLEWTYVPLILPASRYGERVSMHYTLAWFDRYVRDDLSATQRLAATHFDASADASSIGAGTYDPVSGTNVPYRIAGRCVANHASIYYRSAYWLEGGAESEPDLRARGCPADRDGDGVADADDAFPDDPAESADSDADGIGNNADGDDDNDGVADADDACPVQAGSGANGCPEDAPPPSLPERIVQALTDGAAGWCRQVSAASGGAQPYEFCTQFGGPLISPAELDAYETSWVHKALSLQGRLGFDAALVSTTLLHTHNSFNAQDDNTPPTLSGSDFNQYYDITGQLRMDIRAIEMDVHWAPGRAGTAESMGYEPMLCHGLPGSQLNAGCTTEKPLREALQEFRAWLDAHPGEFVMLYIEDDITGSYVGEDLAYATTAQVVEDEIGERVYRPAEHGAACGDAHGAAVPGSWLNVSRGQVLAAGKQVLLVTETCAGGAWDGLFHQMNGANWDQGGGYAGSTYAPGADNCANREPRGREWTRTWEDSTVVTATTSGGSEGGITPAVTRELMRCGLNMPGFDRLTPTDGRLEAAVWSWAAGEPVASATKNCAVHGANGRFFAADCAEPRPLACVGATPNDWTIASGSCPAGTRFSVPHNGYANEKLKEAKAAAGVGEVLLNYSDAAEEGRWVGDLTAPPAGPPVTPPPPPDDGVGAQCTALGLPDALCGALASFESGLAALAGEPAYDQCEPATGACLSELPLVGNVALNLLEPLLNDAPRGVWLKGDLHVHDDHSSDGSGMRQVLGQGAPGNTDISDQIAFAESAGLDFLPLTDHRTFDQHYDPEWRSSSLLLITGEEANSSPHANVFGALDMINQAENPAGAPQFRKLQQSIWDAQLQGAAWQTNHPDDGELETDGDDFPLRDADGQVIPNNYAHASGQHLVEIWNRGTPNGPKIEYCENRWNAGYRFGIAGASDNHFKELWPLAGPGTPTTFVFAAQRSTPALLDGLRAGRTAIRLNASAPFVTFSGDFDGDGTFEALMGDEVQPQPGSRATLRVTIENGIGTTVSVYRQPGLRAGAFRTFVPTLPLQRFDFEVAAPAAGGDWYRVEVRGPGDPDAADYNRALAFDPAAADTLTAMPLRALTSPLFVSVGGASQPQSPLPADAAGDDGAQLIAGAATDNAFAGFASIAEANGLVHAVAEVRAGGSSRVVYRRISGGVAEAPVDLAPASPLATQPRIAAAGAHVWAVWTDHRAGELPHNPQVYARHSGDGGASWDDEVAVSASSGRAAHPALALLAPELPVIAWQDNHGGAFDVLVRVLGRDAAPVNLSAAGKTVTPGNGIDTRSAIYPASVRPSVAIDANGAIVVAWQDNRNDPDPGWTGRTIGIPDDVDDSLAEQEFIEQGTETDDWEIFARALPAGAGAWTTLANVSGAPAQADRNVTLAFDAAGAVHAAWDTKSMSSPAGPRLSIRTASSTTLGDLWTEAQPVALDPQYSSQRPVLGRNGNALSLFWMDGRSADWRWRVMRADHDGSAFGNARFVTGRGNAAWPSYSNGWLAFTSDRSATRAQRQPQQVFVAQLEAAQAATVPNGDAAGIGEEPSAFDLCAGAACLSSVPVVGPALVAALEPVLGGGTDTVTDMLLASCRDAGIPEPLCARAEDIVGSGGLSRWIDPRIGSYPPGFTNPGPFAPWGMVQPGPDTEGPLNYGGYYQHNVLTSGFSHVHMSAGVYKGGYFPVMPITGERTPGELTFELDHPMPAYSSPIDHASESATAGYYSVLLARYGVQAELTATERVGFHRYTFRDPAQAPRVIFDVSRTLGGYRNASVARRADGALVGRVDAGFPVFFAARVNAPFTATTFDGAELVAGAPAVSGGTLGVLLDFADAPEPLLVKVGLSYTDEAGALANLDAEIPGWDFDAVREATRANWDAALGLVEVEGGTDAERTSFYTALYRVQQFPNLHSDVDGRYRGPDGRIHEDTRPHYSQFSSWDSYRGQNQLQAEIAPGRYADMVRSLLVFHEQAGHLPRWQEGSRDAAHMSGDPIIPFIGEAWCRGDLEPGLRAQLWPALTNLPRRRDGELAAKGYLSVPAADLFGQLPGGSGRAGTTLEYGIADFALALMAQHAPDGAVDADAAAIAQRSLNYRNLLDPATQWIRPRTPDGGWLTPFQPELGYGFQEGTSWQYSWLAMHDYAGVIQRMGGDANVNSRLDTFFAFPLGGAPLAWPTVQNQITAFGVAYYGNQYAPGNEHDLEAPFVYNYSGAPWKSQAVARAAASIYTPTPNGLPGNDDLGALSGWLVWTMSGLYPINPGTPLAVIGSPVFEKVTFHRPGGDLVVEAPGASETHKYVQAARVNGAPMDRSWLVLPRDATKVSLELGPAPALDWGAAPAARPPSLSTHSLGAFGCDASS